MDHSIRNLGGLGGQRGDHAVVSGPQDPSRGIVGELAEGGGPVAAEHDGDVVECVYPVGLVDLHGEGVRDASKQVTEFAVEIEAGRNDARRLVGGDHQRRPCVFCTRASAGAPVLI